MPADYIPIQDSLEKTVTNMAALVPSEKRERFQFGNLNFFEDILKLFCKEVFC